MPQIVMHIFMISLVLSSLINDEQVTGIKELCDWITKMKRAGPGLAYLSLIRKLENRFFTVNFVQTKK